MRFWKTYFGTMIIIFVLAVFAYGMSFVYVRSVQTTLGTDVSVLELTKNSNITTFSVLGKDFSFNKSEIDSFVNEAEEKLPCELSGIIKACGAASRYLENLYNSFS